MAALQEVEADIKTIAAKITACKTSGAAKTDPATLKKHVVRERPDHGASVNTKVLRMVHGSSTYSTDRSAAPAGSTAQPYSTENAHIRQCSTRTIADNCVDVVV